MTLLFDENLSFRLVHDLSDLYPHSLHVRDIGLTGHPDEKIWRYAAQERCAIVTKDIDFYQRSMLRGAPPKVIWVRIGNDTRGRGGSANRVSVDSTLHGRFGFDVSPASGRPVIA